MKMTQQIPVKKFKVVAPFFALLLVIFAIWPTSGPHVDSSSVTVGRQAFNFSIIFSPNVSSEKEIYLESEDMDPEDTDMCDKIVPFKDTSGGRISTYDLPKETDYSIGRDGLYKLPEEVLNSTGTDGEIRVTLVPFSHTDPGYGQTVEGYYTSSTKSMFT